MRLTAPIVLAGLAVLAVAPAVAAPPPPPPAPDIPVTFPSSLERAALTAWLKRETDIPADSVVAVSPSALTAIMSSRVMPSPRGFSLALRAEALSPDIRAREGMLSWNTAVDVDCAGRRVRQGATTGYAVRNLLYAGKEVRPADTGWARPAPGSVLENVWRAACEADFQRPLAAPASQVAQVDASAPIVPDTPPMPAPAKPAPKPAAKPQALALRPTLPAQPAAPPSAPQPSEAAPVPYNPLPPPLTPDAITAVSPAPRAPRSAVSGGLAVQVSASTSEAEARRSLAALRSRTGELPTRVARAVVRGKTYYRAIVEGFGTPGEATEFCKALKATGHDCFLRSGG